MILICIYVNDKELTYIQKYDVSNSCQTEELSQYTHSQIGYKLNEILLYHTESLHPISLLTKISFPDENIENAIICLFKKKLNKFTRKISIKCQTGQSLPQH